MDKAVLPEFTGPFPIAKMNFFKIYELTMQVTCTIAAKYQQQMPSELAHYQSRGYLQHPLADAAAGSSFLTALFSDIDIKHEVGRRCERHGEVKLVWDAREKGFKDKNADNFVWKNA